MKTFKEIMTYHKKQCRRALAAARTSRENGHRCRAIRNLDAAAANTWLAVGALRYVESYNEHGVRI